MQGSNHQQSKMSISKQKNAASTYVTATYIFPLEARFQTEAVIDHLQPAQAG